MTSAYGNEHRPVRVKGEVAGFTSRGWEAECGVEGCPKWGSILTWETTKKRAADAVREHYAAYHSHSPAPRTQEDSRG